MSIDDRKIREEIITGLATQHRSGLIRVDVHLGVVDLSGIIFDEHAHEASRVCAENVAGVRSVTDQLAWVKPISCVHSPPRRSLMCRGAADQRAPEG
ncbi:BON domain-containing protein [Paraburkholderia tropica]|uniref:BON domain-containing protein n=1 Tax=Paraburkholderia tropica TaxID=92647 RepID=UPI0038BB2215